MIAVGAIRQPELGEKTDRMIRRRPADAGSYARLETVSASSMRSGRPSSSRAIAARNAERAISRHLRSLSLRWLRVCNSNKA